MIKRPGLFKWTKTCLYYIIGNGAVLKFQRKEEKAYEKIYGSSSGSLLRGRLTVGVSVLPKPPFFI